MNAPGYYISRKDLFIYILGFYVFMGGKKQYALKRVNLPGLAFIMMNILNVILGENDDFLRGREVCDRPCDITPTITHIVPVKFREDVKLLSAYVGDDKFESGLSIDVTLNELLSVVPRKRRRKDAYEALVKYLKDERNIVLTIKSKKS